MEWKYPCRGRPVRVLIAEPDPETARPYQAEFERSDLPKTVHVVSDGDEIQDFIHQRGEFSRASAPDIILLNPELPAADGFGLIEAIKNTPELKRIPIIVVSGSEAEERVVRSYEAHANAYIRTEEDLDWIKHFIPIFEAFWLQCAQLPSNPNNESFQ